MEKGIKIFIACAVGSATGGIMSLSFYHNIWFCILGILVGSFAGYFSYEFKAVISAVRTAWNSVIGWQPDGTVAKNVIKTSALIFGCFVTVWTLIGLPLLILISFSNNTEIHSGKVQGTTVASFMAFILIFLFASICNGNNPDFNQSIAVCKKMRPGYFHSYLFFLLFLKLPWICAKSTVIFFWNVPSFGKRIAVTTAKFVKTVFILVYSEERLICLVYGGIGAGVCYFMGHIIIGTFAGAFFGFINYEILSKRVLHLVPKRT